MLKRALTGLPVALLMLTLAACGEEDNGGEAVDTSSSPTGSSEPTAAESETTESETSGTTGSCEYAPDGQQADVDAPPVEPTVSGDVEVTIDSSIGELHATLDGKGTPCTVGSFVSLAEQGFFDGTSCHRMTTSPNFEVLQCGDPGNGPGGPGTGGPGYTIPDEITGDETYPAGTLAMANTGMPNSGGSQFFICYGDTALPPSYTVFGTVDQETIDLIADAAEDGTTPPDDGAPNTPIDFETVTVGS